MFLLENGLLGVLVLSVISLSISTKMLFSLHLRYLSHFGSFFDENVITNMRFMTWSTLNFLICGYYSPVLLAEISYIDYLTPSVSVKNQILTNIA